ncbi:alpha/beta hydrolase [Nocardia brasiliensis]|uniref:alpha/beta hydrolase n=1 Tax=Nocardia brasiliensis TaxID=37326 RepID=UPI002B4AD53C|nr:alpha/beta hydrolase [Nocardia brasiliensis]
MTQHQVEFPAEDGVLLRGTLYLPDGPGPHPAITMAGGFGSVRQQGIQPYTDKFAAAGFAVLSHDHRSFGESDGEPRQDIDPWRQIHDWRRALSFLEARPEIDAQRIGLWGNSYAGGHAIVLGATDRRLRAIVAQVPNISGYQSGLRRVPPDLTPAFECELDEDERTQAQGNPPRYQALVDKDPAIAAAYHAPDAVDFYLSTVPEGARWENTVTLRSTRKARMYDPGTFAARVSPTPLLMIVASHDTISPTDLALAAYHDALEPKRLELVPGGHFDPYLSGFEHSSDAALDWFTTHLA